MSRIGSPDRIDQAIKGLHEQAQVFRTAVERAVELGESLDSLSQSMGVARGELEQLIRTGAETNDTLTARLAEADERLASLVATASELESHLSAAFATLSEDVESRLATGRRENEKRLDAIEDFLRGRVRDVQGALEPLRENIGALRKKTDALVESFGLFQGQANTIAKRLKQTDDRLAAELEVLLETLTEHAAELEVLRETLTEHAATTTRSLAILRRVVWAGFGLVIPVIVLLSFILR